MRDEMLFENLDYGAYILTYPTGYFSENIKYASADFNKLNTRRVRLPDGKGNIIYLMSNTFENTLKMVNNNNFIIPPSYKRIFYPAVSVGTFIGRRYRVSLRKLINERKALVQKNTKLRSYGSMHITNTTENIFFSTSDIYEAILPIMDKFNLKVLYQNFWKDFVGILNNHSPNVEGSKIIIIDCEAFGFRTNDTLSVVKNNPLFLLYFAYLRLHDLSKLNVNIDMLICYKNMFLKFNPSKINNEKTWSVFKRALFRIMNNNLDDYVNSLSKEDKKEISDAEQDTKLSKIVTDVVNPYTKMVSQTTRSTVLNAVEKSVKKKIATVAATDQEIKLAKEEIQQKIGVDKPMEVFKKTLDNGSLIHTNPVTNPLDQKRISLFRDIAGSYNALSIEDDTIQIEDPDDEIDINDYEDEIKSDAEEVLSIEDEVLSEVIDDIQDRTVPLSNPKTAPVNSARDKKLRDEQKKVVVKNSTIEEILEQDSDNVPIKKDDKSAVMHTSNKNMYSIAFNNFDKTYIDEMYTKDILQCFDQLKDKESPFYITSVDVKDTSDASNYKETWTVVLRDEVNKKHTIKVDIPKFYNDRFMLIKDIKYIIIKQNFYNPLVKDTPDTVILTTNFNKITIRRSATKSISTIERIFSFNKKIEKLGENRIFSPGDSTSGNRKYISSLEYDELSRRIFKYSSGNCELYFSRDYISNNLSDQIPEDIKGSEFYIGHEGNIPVLINEDTGLDRMGRTIAQIIEENLDETNRAVFNSVNTPKQLMFVEAKLAGEFIPVIAILVTWLGLKKSLDEMGITWKFDPNTKTIPKGDSQKYIKFADGILQYEPKTFAELILNGLTFLKPDKKKFEDFETEEGYAEYIYSKWGSYNGINELNSFYNFLMDPITKRVCKSMMLPDTNTGLLIYAVKLLSDNAYVSKASDKSYRTRSIEMIPGILYSYIAAQYKAYVKSGRTIPMTLKQDCVIRRLISEKNVEAYSTLNPVVEISKAYTISAKGYRGANSDFAYSDEAKRSYDPSSVGKIAISTSADANVGINRIMVVEPTISNSRGYREQVDDIDTLKDINVFSPVEMLTPGTARNDDPIRTAINGLQTVAVKLY